MEHFELFEFCSYSLVGGIISIEFPLPPPPKERDGRKRELKKEKKKRVASASLAISSRHMMTSGGWGSGWRYSEEKQMSKGSEARKGG